MKDWYKQLVVYQIWPRSFCDGNGDGIGDLEGVLSKLDYLQDLGINCIWFSPLYPSPNADFGYDIADYKNIHKEYGNLDLFRQVLDGAHKRGMKVIMDLVVNHTSDEHEWFIKSKDPSSPYHDYYFWRKGRLGGKLPPNNWLSCFEGKAWERDEKSGEYYLHVFAKKQPDLNHDNPKVRQEVKDIMKFWLDMGVDGFREDVITFISKRPGLPNGIPLPIGCGIEHYMDGPNIHKYLSEYREITDKYDCFTVGEAPMMTPDNALKYIDESHKELDMMFHFQHIEADAFLIDFLQTKFRLKEMKKAFTNWQNKLNGRAWNTLYIENHDHPRIISRYGNEKYRVQSGKMLANMYMLQQGTPFVYQGQELGMLNTRLGSIDDEMGEDYAKLAGLTAEEDLQETTKQSIKKRLPWLVVLLVLGMGVSAVVGAFENVVAILPIVICFQSLILDMAGNVGTQSLAVTIRVLMDEELAPKDKLKLVLKEAKVGFSNGFLLGILAIVFLGLYIFLYKGYDIRHAFLISLCVGVSLLLAMIVSSLVGTLVPLFFKKIKVDPAVASGPLITTVNDLVAVVIYYGLSWVFLIQTMHILG